MIKRATSFLFSRGEKGKLRVNNQRIRQAVSRPSFHAQAILFSKYWKSRGEVCRAALRTQTMLDIAILVLLTVLALLVHGYHLGLEDEAVYLPAIKYHLNPHLYPHDSFLFLTQMKLTLYDKLIALAVSLSHLRIERFTFLAHLISIFLVLLGCLGLSRRLFLKREAQWASVALIAALLTLPVTGSALQLLDQYLHPRSFATAFILFSITCILDKRPVRAICWLLLTAMISPLMTLYGISFAALLMWKGSWPHPLRSSKLFLASGLALAPDIDIWSEVTRPYYYLLHWSWYELLGVVAPVVLLFSMSSIQSGTVLPSFKILCRRISLFGIVFSAITLAMGTPLLERFLSLQPMRSFHLVYMVFFLSVGGLIGEKILKNKPLRWVLLFLPLCVGMFAAQRYQFAASDHIEWPGIKPRNQWVQAFKWISENTPGNAFFALDPYFMECRGEDFHGFRALAERSMMADLVKDPAVVSVLFTANKLMANPFTGVSEKWHEQVSALRGWKNFGIEDFGRLNRQFGVDWVVLEKPGVSGLRCPYENDAVMVCHVD